jgi:hypothetical protein
MPIAERTAEVIWDGSLARGRGTVESGSGAPVVEMTSPAAIGWPEHKLET